jgi:hypothetical protein
MYPQNSLGQIEREKWLRLPSLKSRRMQELLIGSAVIAGALCLLGACAYRRVWHPEWTGGQALQALWPFYLAAALSIYCGWRFNHARGR